MLKYFIEKVVEKKGFARFFMPRIMVCVPTGVTEVEKRAVEEATRQAGAREVYIIEEPIAAAIGAGIDISKAKWKYGYRYWWRNSRYSCYIFRWML